MHVGSLVAALASYLEARAQGGTWLLRMEDLDRARVIPGAADDILRSLELLGLYPDEPVSYQHERVDAYREALRTLRARDLVFDCSCTRRDLVGAPENVAGDGPVYPGFCRDGPRSAGPCATRLRTGDETVEFVDALQGEQRLRLAELGDPVVWRRDGIPAYQLAVVVDDHWQRITHVVRGADLLLCTAWQRLLQRGLGYDAPGYMHLPLIVEPDGAKLAKSRRSLPLRDLEPGFALYLALELLRQGPPTELQNAPVAATLSWANEHWRPAALAGVRTVPVNRDFSRV